MELILFLTCLCICIFFINFQPIKQVYRDVEVITDNEKYIVIEPLDNLTNCDKKFLYLKMNYEFLAISKDRKFKELVFKRFYEDITKISLFDNIFSINLEDGKLFEFKVPRMQIKDLTAMMEDLQKYKDMINSEL